MRRNIAIICLGWLVGTAAPAAENPVYQLLTEQGIAVGAAGMKRLPGPTMADGLDAAAQHRALASICDANHTSEALLRKAVVAPFVLRIQDDAPGSTVRRVDAWFVAYGTLKQICSDEFWQSDRARQAGSTSGIGLRGQLLDAEQLNERKLTAPNRDEYHEQYVAGECTLFDRVQVSGTLRSIRTHTTTSVLMASILDPRFRDDRQFPNRWRSLDRDEAGNVRLGEPRAHEGVGSYVKVTALVEPPGALFVEYHLVFDEPAEWFRGANLLRSKLPLAVQDGIRKFRRRLTESF